MKKLIKTIDITPTWSSILPILVDMVQTGNTTQIHWAKEELKRMATLADERNTLVKDKTSGT